MREFIIKSLSGLNVKCQKNLNKYVDFCLVNNISYSDGLSIERHHILPRSVFKQFENLKNNPWNVSNLTPENHYIAHALLHLAVNNYSFACAWYAMNNKNRKMYNGKELLGPELYGKLIRKRNKQCSIAATGLVMAKELDSGKTVKVPRDEFLLDDNLVGHTIGKGGEHLRGLMPVLDENGKTKQIRVEEFDPEIHIGHTKGFTSYKNSMGDVLFLKKDDPRVLSGEYFGINTGNKFKNLGSKGQQLKLGIFNKEGELVHECLGNFVETCEEYKLPIQLLRKTRKNNSVIEFNLENKRKCSINRMKNSGVLDYEGWYVRKLTFVN